jgi:anti-sigma factor RsiW
MTNKGYFQMKCKDVERDLILYYYGEIDDTLKSAISNHIASCDKCASAWERVKATLDISDVKDPELPESFWQNYRRKVYQKIEDKKSPAHFGLLKPRLVQVAAMILVILLIGLGGGKLYKAKQEEAFITKNYELIKNFEMFEDFEILQHLEEIETVKEI